MNVHAVVAEFAVEVIEPIHAEVILFKPISVVAILTEICVHQQIAVLAGAGEVNVITVLVVPLNVQCHGRNLLLDLSNLFEKGAREIDVLSVITRIPLITIPTFPAVVGLVQVRCILRKRFPLTHATFSGVQIALVTECQPALLSAIRTVSGRGDRILLLSDDRRDRIVEL